MIEFWIECRLDDESEPSVWKKFRAPTLPCRHDWLEYQLFGPEEDSCADFLHYAPNFHFNGDECFICLEIEVSKHELEKLRGHEEWTTKSPLKAFRDKRA